MQSNALGYYCNWTVLDFYALSCLHFNSHWLISCNKVEPSLLCWWSREANHRTWWHLGLSCLCTAGLLQSSSETLFNEIWNACWLYIDMWGNVWAKAAVTNPQVLSTAYKPNVGIPRFIGLTKKHDFMGLKSEKINHQWSSQFDCRAANPLRSAVPWDQPHTGGSWEGERKWDFDKWYIGIQGMVWDKWERGEKRIQWVQTAVEADKALALSSWLGKFRDNGGWQWISQCSGMSVSFVSHDPHSLMNTSAAGS